MIEIKVNCTQYSGYANARVELDGDLDDPIELNSQEPLNAIALAVLKHLMVTGKLKLAVNGKEVVTQELDETPYQDFFEGCEWFYDHDIMK